MAYINYIHVSVDTNKVADILLMKRESVLDAAAPYKAMRVVRTITGIVGEEDITPKRAIGPFPELTDIGFMAKVSATTGAVDIDFELSVYDR